MNKYFENHRISPLQADFCTQLDRQYNMSANIGYISPETEKRGELWVKAVAASRKLRPDLDVKGSNPNYRECFEKSTALAKRIFSRLID